MSDDIQERFNLARAKALASGITMDRLVAPKGALKGLPDPDLIDWSKVDQARKKCEQSTEG